MTFRGALTGGARKARLALSGALSQSVNVLKEALNRSLSLPDVAANVLDLLPAKKLRLRIVILRDETLEPLSHVADVLPSVEAAQAIFEIEAGTKLVPFGGRFIEISSVAAPTEALDVHCDMEAWMEGFGQAGDFFESHLARNSVGMLTGYAAPVTAFIVRDVRGKAGCSLGPLADYVTVALCGLAPCAGEGVPNLPRILAHEIGHACGLWHVRDSSNLMDPLGPGVELRWWQKVILRNSRHVTYF